MSFEEKVEFICRSIYKKVSIVVDSNKDNDEKLYRSAKLNLADGRKMFFTFEPYSFGDDRRIGVDNFQFDEVTSKRGGDDFSLDINEKNKEPLSSLHITIYGQDEYDDRRYYAGMKDGKFVFSQELSEEDKIIIIQFLEKLQEACSSLVYDKERTHSFGNMTWSAQEAYRMQQFDEEMKKIPESDEGNKILPVVQKAVDWWANMISGDSRKGSIGDDFDSSLGMGLSQMLFSKTSISEEQLKKFKFVLSTLIMEELRKGREIWIKSDYEPEGLLATAMSEAGISPQKAPYKTIMIVNINSIIVRAGYSAEPEEIFKTDEENVDTNKKSL